MSSLSPAAQAKFLRVLQEKNFRRLSGVATHPFRARLIVSSRRDLAALVEQGAFRDDFFYRIDVVSVRLPRLADRREDILPLAREFLKRAARAYARPARRFTPEAEKTLLRHSWPGNVRELLHVVEKAVLTADADGDRAGGSSDRRARRARVAAGGGRREPLDAEGAHRCVHRRDTAPGGRKPVAGRETARRLAQVPVGAGKENEALRRR